MTRGQEPAPRSIAPEVLLPLVNATIERIHETPDLPAAALVLAESTVQHLGADVAGVTYHPRRGVPQRLATTDAVLDRLDDVVATSPLGDPLAEGTAVRIGNTATDDRWPEWAVAAHALGLRSALLAGIPEIRGHAVTLEIYGREPHTGPRVEPAVATEVITLIGHALQHADRSSNLEGALHTRGLVGQAQGILMERFGLDGDQAMAYLRRESQRSQQPVRKLAAAIVAERESRVIGD